MNEKRGQSSLWTTFCFISLVFVFLGVVLWIAPSEPVGMGSLSVRFPSVGDIVSDNTAMKLISVEEQLAAMEAETHNNSPQDSLRDALADSLAFYESFFSHSASSISYPDSDYTYFFPFYNSLDNARQELVHVMHYGDSQIEGDRITHLLRDSLQSRFGGHGPGLIPLVQPIERYGLRQIVSGSVQPYYGAGIMGERAPHNRYGAMMQMASLRDEDTVRLDIEAFSRNSFRRVVLYAGSVKEPFAVAMNGATKSIAPSVALRQIIWTGGRKNRATLTLLGQADIYGVALDDGTGVSVSNIPLRGSDGTFFTRCDAASTGGMLRHLNTRLIILEFGGNALPLFTDSAHIDTWTGQFGRQIDCVRRLCPNARILVVGPADMCVSADGLLSTYLLLPYLTEAMRRTSHAHGAAYWDMYAVMGGYNSMLAWVKHQPPLASTDYVHFTRRGAEKLAAVLWKAFRMNYDYMHLTLVSDTLTTIAK